MGRTIHSERDLRTLETDRQGKIQGSTQVFFVAALLGRVHRPDSRARSSQHAPTAAVNNRVMLLQRLGKLGLSPSPSIAALSKEASWTLMQAHPNTISSANN